MKAPRLSAASLTLALLFGALGAGCGAASDGSQPGETQPGEEGSPGAKNDDPTQAPTTPEIVPVYHGYAEAIPQAVRDQMTGVSWTAACPVPLDDLKLLHLDHYGFDGKVHEGLMIVHADVADDVVAAFGQIFAAKFPIRKMVLVDQYGVDPGQPYGASDEASMAEDNTSAFNCRPSTGTTQFSQHAWGRAIDLNPIENPYVKDATVLPLEGADYLDRSVAQPGMILRGGPVTSAFSAIGWKWGGNWRSLKDYQHFSRNGF